MSQTFYAVKDLVIDGRPVARGETIPASVPLDRVHNGVRIGSIAVRRPAEPVPAEAPGLPAPESDEATERRSDEGVPAKKRKQA